MQPYFFPYIGYFQLIRAVDKFVLFDDVNYKNRGFIDRNTILMGGDLRSIKLQLKRASQNKLINEIELGDNRATICETIRHAYSKASMFVEFYPVVKRILESKETNLSLFLYDLLQTVISYLNIECEILRSSQIVLPEKGKDKILPLVRELGAEVYLNMAGGVDMYSSTEFKKAGVRLGYIEPDLVEYPQLSSEFHTSLSIIDLLMNVSKDDAKTVIGCPESILK